ncbi:hypothetical protein HHO41_08835 [Bacillus sp. DNRA2]|uniref:hypothetical protein n=1 Tax=Bacillus sp. DNRA2 TaxID=2723053 RepID=UPI00145D431C|nr:hypothetical protein [Bacillus sp. DNRA2]NMD70398.1 hypothetical protein [Bacillus sp. DNRA2]
MYYILWYRINLKKAVEASKDAIFPQPKEELAKILIPAEWKEMQPLTKHSRSYRLVNWGTVLVIILFSGLFTLALVTDWFQSEFLNLIYFFCVAISAIHHPGNFYICQNGLVLNGKYHSFTQVKHYQVEQIIRWHDLYGLDSRVNNAYKLSFDVKNTFTQPNFIVIEDLESLNTIVGLLQKHNISKKNEIQQAK